MGLLDTVTCEYPLPLGDKPKELESPPDWAKIEFQTSSFSTMEDMWGPPNAYTIEDNGDVYKSCTERKLVEDEEGILDIKERDDGIERVEHTGEVIFQTVHLEEKHDHIISFKALFWKGDLKEIDLEEWKTTDNAARLEAQEKFKSKMQTLIAAENKWHKKFFEPFKICVRVILGLTKFFFGLFAKVLMKIESWVD